MPPPKKKEKKKTSLRKTKEWNNTESHLFPP